MGEVFLLPRGTDRDFPLRVIDAYTGADFLLDGTYSLTAQVWIGDDQVPLIAPSVFLDGTPPTPNILVRFQVSDTTNLEPGDYLFQAFATVSGVRRALISDEPAILRIQPTAGASTSVAAWIGADDLRGYFPVVDQLLSSQSSQSGFLEERAAATEDFKRMIVDRYQARPGFARRRSATYDPVHGYDLPDKATAVPTKAELRAALDANKLTVDSTAVEIMSLMALAQILGGELTQDSRNNPYQDLGRAGMAQSQSTWRTWQAYIDFDGDDIADAIIDRDVTFLV